jgi:hypothetical protein
MSEWAGEVSRYPAVVGPLTLTLTAIAMAIVVNKDRVRALPWAVAFLAIGGISVAAVILNQQRSREEMFGGEQFAFVSALYGPGMDPKGNSP